MSPEISVVVCTKDPRTHYLNRALEALSNQTLALEKWEILVVDNGSKVELSSKVDLSWHPASRHLREDQLGLTAARLAGIAGSRGRLLVFVDDDNILAKNYLETSLKIGHDYPFIGAWGGTCDPEFEVTPPSWVDRHLCLLAIRKVSRIIWTNDSTQYGVMPFGAGLVVRKSVAERYSQLLKSEPHRGLLDRKGRELMGGGDLDLARCSCRIGLGFGVFPELELVHLIPPERLKLDYLCKLALCSKASIIMLEFFDGVPIPNENAVAVAFKRILQWFVLDRSQWKILRATDGAVALAHQQVRANKGQG